MTWVRRHRIVARVIVVVVVMWIEWIVVAPPIPVVVEWIIAHRPVPIVPRVAWISPHRVVERIYMVAPAIVPWRGVDTEGDIRCTPRAKHRGNVLRLNPHLIARHHDVVVRWIVCCNIVYRAAVEHVVVARWHIVGGRLEAIQATCVGTLVVIRHNACERRLVVEHSVVLRLCSIGICLCYECLILRSARLRSNELRLGLSLKLRSHLGTIICPI